MVVLNNTNSTTKRMPVDNGLNEVWGLLEQVKDPEIPVLSLRDLGILRNVERMGSKLKVTITPTYSGCPAMDTIRDDIKQLLYQSGYEDVEIKTVLSPAWTTDWMTEEGKSKLQQFGIAPPGKVAESLNSVLCPRCRSTETRLISEYGSTACKSMYQCNVCKEPFCYFKAI